MATSWNCKLLKKAGDINLFTISDDKALGKQVSEQIASDPKQFPVLPEKGNEEVYKYIRGLTKQLKSRLSLMRFACRRVAFRVELVDVLCFVLTSLSIVVD